jgi:hypothetical protein
LHFVKFKGEEEWKAEVVQVNGTFSHENDSKVALGMQ